MSEFSSPGVTSHDELSGINTADHHDKPTQTGEASIAGGYVTPEFESGTGTDGQKTVDGDTGTVGSIGDGNYLQYFNASGITGVRYFEGGTTDESLEIRDGNGDTLATFTSSVDSWVEVSLGVSVSRIRVYEPAGGGTSNPAEVEVDQPMLAPHSHGDLQ